MNLEKLRGSVDAIRRTNCILPYFEGRLKKRNVLAEGQEKKVGVFQAAEGADCVPKVSTSRSDHSAMQRIPRGD